MNDSSNNQFFDSTVTNWMHKLVDGDSDAAEKLWQRYCGQIYRLAKKHLGFHPRRASDEEDVAISAFHVFCQGAMKGKFPQLDDRNNLWRLLVVITARKASDHVKHERPRTPPGTRQNDEVLENVMGESPTPEFAAQVAEETDRLLELLPDDTLRQIAQAKLEGYTNEEIAEQLGCSLRTIERKLWRIRAEWS